MGPFSGNSDETEPQSVPVGRLRPGTAIRQGGQNTEHVRYLAGTAAVLPPILVHRASMRVVDGMHRLRAAALRGDQMIDVVYFDGDEDEAFVQAVRENTAHGLPLSVSDRKAAALRILKAHPYWSDRWIGQAVSLSPKTVAVVRREAGPDVPVARTRIGRDGRQRRLRETKNRGAESGGRIMENMVLNRGVSQRTSAVMITPQAPAPLVGRDPGRVVSGKASLPIPPRASAGIQPPTQAGAMPRQPSGTARGAGAAREIQAVIHALARDPSLRGTDPGRELLRRLIMRAVEPGDWEEMVAAVPPHCAQAVAEVAMSYARAWSDLAIRMHAVAQEAGPTGKAVGLVGRPSPGA